MRLYQIPFSHNCIKARHVLDLKGADYDVVNINPALRGDVKHVSGQELVPALVDGDRAVTGSTPIPLHLEERELLAWGARTLGADFSPLPAPA